MAYCTALNKQNLVACMIYCCSVWLSAIRPASIESRGATLTKISWRFRERRSCLYMNGCCTQIKKQQLFYDDGSDCDDTGRTSVDLCILLDWGYRLIIFPLITRVREQQWGNGSQPRFCLYLGREKKRKGMSECVGSLIAPSCHVCTR